MEDVIRHKHSYKHRHVAVFLYVSVLGSVLYFYVIDLLCFQSDINLYLFIYPALHTAYLEMNLLTCIIYHVLDVGPEFFEIVLVLFIW